MSLKQLYIIFFFLLTAFLSFSQGHEDRLSEIDIQHYRFQLELTDKDDFIYGKAKVSVKFLKSISEFELDLVGLTDKDDFGMEVSEIICQNVKVDFEHVDDRLILKLKEAIPAGKHLSFIINYYGIPGDGLIISNNKYGDRTFFGDNWPNRARHWLPCVDHPSDKATVEFVVTTPDHYQVIANGAQFEETNIDDETKLTHWIEEVPLPTKVMVIGAARFAVNEVGKVKGIPVSSWVYRQDKEKGFYDYRIAVGVLDFFCEKMGDYPYEKLANVQSKTRYGGMENAGNIFYYENSVNGMQDQENLIAHEIAHQWFGNSASELSWHHIWLSEGFATYFTDLYLEEVHGRDAFVINLMKEREKVIGYYNNQKNPRPIVDVDVKDYNKLLNPNSYQKGAWVLHMLRYELGDDIFIKGIKKYYQMYKLSNALSEDFQAVMEKSSGKDLSMFFKQWLYQPGHPKIKTKLNKRSTKLEITQVQKEKTFRFPLGIEITNEDGKTFHKVVQINKKKHKIKLDIEGKVKKIRLDPNCWLLFEKARSK